MTELPNSLHGRAVAYQLNPNTDLRAFEEAGPTVIDHGKGIHVYDDAGREYIEGMAGMWSVAVGFGEQRLIDAAMRQFQKLPYYHVFA